MKWFIVQDLTDCASENHKWCHQPWISNWGYSSPCQPHTQKQMETKCALTFAHMHALVLCVFVCILFDKISLNLNRLVNHQIFSYRCVFWLTNQTYIFDRAGNFGKNFSDPSSNKSCGMNSPISAGISCVVMGTMDSIQSMHDILSGWSMVWTTSAFSTLQRTMWPPV